MAITRADSDARMTEDAVRLKLIFTMLTVAILAVACVRQSGNTPGEPTVGIANPASVNCAEQGGTLQVERRPDGGEFGVCYFEDNRQCEEWALMRGDCPVGGVKVTGYVTDAGRFCAISGGNYAVIVEGDALTEEGSCTLPGGVICDARAFWKGTCAAE